MSTLNFNVFSENVAFTGRDTGIEVGHGAKNLGRGSTPSPLHFHLYVAVP